MKTTEEIIILLEEKVKEMQLDAKKGLHSLNNRVSKQDANVNSMYGLSESYYIEVARYAWAFRQQLICSYELQSLIKTIKE